jgi:hypothetical protein
MLALKFVGLSECNIHRRSTGRQDSPVGLSVICIVDRFGVEIWRRNSSVGMSVTRIGQSVHHRNLSSKDCQNSKIGLSITTKLIHRAWKFIGRSVCHRHHRSTRHQNLLELHEKSVTICLKPSLFHTFPSRGVYIHWLVSRVRSHEIEQNK